MQLFVSSEKLKIDQRVFISFSKELNNAQSNFQKKNIEITSSEAGNYDAVVIQDFLKEIVQTRTADILEGEA
ncbi:hypothetical protein CY34DRAFT_812956 [Suillus luteus UH-Slu-Lm8-n1]|uniref:Uncharacterized protein n=1 Tax=Suillus luteus UH-Slu-Lm8-n1 TaxID=930992 RepID=A0A0D0AJG9_9AGAM|nr:hypothetical protein CY34DRAFT_812956 [Suillus luteus UH-Slu-Lm8-n1]